MTLRLVSICLSSFSFSFSWTCRSSETHETRKLRRVIAWRTISLTTWNEEGTGKGKEREEEREREREREEHRYAPVRTIKKYSSSSVERRWTRQMQLCQHPDRTAGKKITISGLLKTDIQEEINMYPCTLQRKNIDLRIETLRNLEWKNHEADRDDPTPTHKQKVAIFVCMTKKLIQGTLVKEDGWPYDTKKKSRRGQ